MRPFALVILLGGCSLKPDPEATWREDTGTVFAPWVQALDQTQESCTAAWEAAVACYERAGADPAPLESWGRSCAALPDDPALTEQYDCMAAVFTGSSCVEGTDAAVAEAAACAGGR